jgi:23S rRNA (pseudouridine1915-N3)-methyltransferase
VKLHIIAVGHKMAQWVDLGFAEYAKRMPLEARIELIEIKPEKRVKGASMPHLLELEAQRIEAHLSKVSPVVVLDERGDLWDTARLAQSVAKSLGRGEQPGFVIGSADGLHGRIKERADYVVALSRLTLPHALARVVLAEQLYRAVSLLQNRPYHRE